MSTKAAPVREFLSINDVAKVLNCSRGHVVNLVAKKLIPSIDIGIDRSKVRVRPEDLDLYIASSASKS